MTTQANNMKTLEEEFNELHSDLVTTYRRMSDLCDRMLEIKTDKERIYWMNTKMHIEMILMDLPNLAANY